MNISESERDALYKVIFSRRDVRSEFLPTPIPNDVLSNLLKAAHHAPSVGFMQPWDFIVVDNEQTKVAIKAGFTQANEQAESLFSADKRSQYSMRHNHHRNHMFNPRIDNNHCWYWDYNSEQ